MAITQSPYFRPTRFAILSTSLLNEPFASLYVLLPFILHKNLGATALEIVILTILKPLVSVFSFYWSAHIDPQKLRSNMTWAGVLARVPFLFFPWFHDVWFVVLSGATYMLFTRAAIPAWMEILKRNLPKETREKLFSTGSALGYAEGIFLALFIGQMLDNHPSSWGIFFFSSALLGIISVFVQSKIPIATATHYKAPQTLPLTQQIVQPWQNMLRLIKSRPDFACFQWGFMAAGFGIMLIIPVLPIFFSDVLHLSYTDLAIAFCICKGLGFVFFSPIWARAMNRMSIASLTCLICLGFASFSIFLLFAPFSSILVYLAYIIYGVAQAGSHLLWHLSGPLFSQGEDSSQYSGVNILTVGMRGMIAPALGGLFCGAFGPIAVLAFGIGLCIYGGYHMIARSPAALRAKLK